MKSKIWEWIKRHKFQIAIFFIGVFLGAWLVQALQ